MVDKTIAIIPARGGSKRIPQKNIRDFKGKPMIAWTIQAAIETNLFDRVIVSTDDQKTAEIAIEYGAECPFLRDNAADDISPVSDATIHALEQAEQHFGESYHTVVQLMANCPLRSAKTIAEMVENFKTTNSESMLSHTRYGWLNPWWASELNERNEVTPLFEQQLKERSQDLNELYCPTGAIWIAKTSALKEHKTFHTPNKNAFILNWKEAVDIDDMEDWSMAEITFEHMKADS